MSIARAGTGPAAGSEHRLYNAHVAVRCLPSEGKDSMEIITPRLQLRDFVIDDWPAVLAYQSDPRYLRYYEWTERTEEQVRAFVGRFVDNQNAQPRTKFQPAIVLRADGRLIGNCGLRLPAPEARVAEMGCELAPDAWGQGYAAEAARAMLAFGFEHLRLHRVWANCMAENAAAWHLLEKLGFEREGRLRDHEWFKGRWWDTLIYGLLEPERSPQ